MDFKVSEADVGAAGTLLVIVVIVGAVPILTSRALEHLSNLLLGWMWMRCGALVIMLWLCLTILACFRELVSQMSADPEIHLLSFSRFSNIYFFVYIAKNLFYCFQLRVKIQKSNDAL